MWDLYKPKDNYREDLLEKRTTDDFLKILGTIENNGKTSWENIQLNAEFFSPDGNFVDEASNRIDSSVELGAVEHFKM